MNLQIYTHNDLDAAGGIVLLKSNNFNINEIQYHNYNSIDAAILKFISNEIYLKKDIKLLIFDICPSDEICKKLNSIENLNLLLLDHHNTKLWANKYSWAKINIKNCGTKLILDEFIKNKKNEYEIFVNSIQAWDLWEEASIYRERGIKLNTLFKFINRAEFIKEFTKDINSDLKDPFNKIINYIENNKNNYIGRIIKNQLLTAKRGVDGLGNKFCIIFSSEYISEVCHKILNEEDDIDYVICIKDNFVSLRSKKENVDVGKIAAYFHGGGHKHASGFIVNFTQKIEQILENKLNRINY